MKRILMAALVTASLAVAVASVAPAQDMRRATTPEDVGLSSERLKRLSSALKEGVDPAHRQALEARRYRLLG